MSLSLSGGRMSVSHSPGWRRGSGRSSMLGASGAAGALQTSRDLWLPLQQPPRPRPYMGTVAAAKSALGEYDEQRILDEYEEDAELLELCIQHTSDEVRAVLQRHKEMEQSLGSCSQPVCFQNGTEHRPIRPVRVRKQKPEEELIEGRMPSTYVRLHARQQVSNWLRKRSSRRSKHSSVIDLAGSVVPGGGGPKFPSTGTVGSFERWQFAKDHPEHASQMKRGMLLNRKDTYEKDSPNIGRRGVYRGV